MALKSNSNRRRRTRQTYKKRRVSFEKRCNCKKCHCKKCRKTRSQRGG